MPITLLKLQLRSSNPFWNTNAANKIAVKLRPNRGKNARFNSEIIGRKLIKFVQDITGLLSLNLSKADLRLANPLLNAEAKSKGRSARRLRTSPKFN